MSNREAEIHAIEQLAAAWRLGWLAGDADALLDLYTDDPVLLPHGQPPVAGRDAIRSLYEAVFRDFDIESETALHEVDCCGHLGYFWSAYRLTAIPKGGGEPATSAGKSVFIVKRQGDGAWRVALLIDNGDSE